MTLLSGGAAALFGELLSPLYLDATCTRQATTYDQRGGIRRAADPLPCRVQVNRCTERMVQTEGYTSSDRAIYVLASSLAGDLDTDCELAVLEGPDAGTTWRVADPITRDPGAAYWLCRGTLSRATPDA